MERIMQHNPSDNYELGITQLTTNTDTNSKGRTEVEWRVLGWPQCGQNLVGILIAEGGASTAISEVPLSKVQNLQMLV